VLFLDEMTQFSNATLQSLRQPIEEGVIQIVRAADAVSYPSRVMVIGAANPCPCGYFGDTQKNCRCLPGQIEQYQKRIGGPIMDRFDVVITVARPETDRLFERGDGTSSAELARVVARAWEFACKRGAGPNRSLSREYLTSDCAIEADALATVKTGAKRLHLSGRGIVRCLRLARTIADMEQSPRIARSHLIEALSYRGGWFSDVS
jgi:magnesium chelatase family protein